MEYVALDIELNIVKVELTEAEVVDLKSGELSNLDFETHYVFLDPAEWIKFKAQANQF